MFDTVFNRSRPGICQLTYEDATGTRTSTGTGFLFREKLVTCCHVASGACLGGKVRIKFGAWDAVEHCFSTEQFAERLEKASPRSHKDLAVYDASFYPRYKECSLDTPRVMPAVRQFQELAIIGYPFGDPVPTCHRAWITDLSQSDGIETWRLEGFINVGNSGGPLLTLQEGGVVGVVVRKQPGLSPAFQQMKTGLLEELKELHQSEFSGAAKTIQAHLAQLQNYVRILADEVERSSNTGIGYAVSVGELIEMLASVSGG